MDALTLIKEKDFQQAVMDCARYTGWLVYHTYDARRNAAGFPDLVLVRGGRVIFAELKTMRGRLSPAQVLWRDALCAGGTEWYLWRPSDWDAITTLLTR